MSSSSKNNSVYVGRLTKNVQEESIHSLFNKYGKIKDIDLKQGYAFIQYEDPSVLDEVVDKLNDKTFENLKLFVVKASERHVSQYSEKGPQSTDKCYNCDKFGHWANECRNRSVKPPRRQRRNSRNYSSASSSSSSDRSNSKQKRNNSKKNDKKSYSKSGSSSKSRSKSRSHSKSSSEHQRKKNKHKQSKSKSRSKSRSESKKKREKSKKQQENSDQGSNK